MGIGCLTIYIFFALLFLLPLLFANLVTGAFVVLGFTEQQALYLLIFSLLGSAINIPVKRWENGTPQNPQVVNNDFLNRFNRMGQPSGTVLAVNLGGAIIPGAVSLWQVWRLLTRFSSSHPHGFWLFITVLLINITVSYNIARPVENKGIALPAFIPPVVVTIPSLLFAPSIAPVIAFPAGVLGVLIGADILHLKDIKKMNSPVGSIGGAGTFDGVFLCGIISVFLTA